MALSAHHMQTVCLAYNGAKQCRYLDLTFDPKTYQSVSLCRKLILPEKKKIDAEVHQLIDTAKKNGQDPKMMGKPIGDNCKGYPLFRHIQQGVDVDRKKKK